MLTEVTLTEVMRQKGDTFAAMLNRLRCHIRGNPLQPEDKTTLSTRSYDDTPEHTKDFLHIFPSTKEVDRHNEEMVKRKCNPVFSSLATDFYRDLVTGKVSQRETPYATTAAEDLQTHVKLGVGARIMLTRNLDTDDGFVNGAFGTITVLDQSSTTSISAVYIKFDNPKIGLKCKKKSLVHNSKKDSVSIKPVEENLHGKQITRKQFPCKLGWATTIHKVQGMTVTNIVISMKKIFQPGMAYVALSRATSLTGLHILNYDENTIYSFEDKTSAIEKMPPFLLSTTTEPTFSSSAILHVIQHNTEGILPHLADIRQDSAKNVL